MTAPYDLLVIGGGPGGYTAAIRAAQEGMKTALVEARALGGVCLNRGCIPTKALLHAAKLYREAREGARFGVHAATVRYDLTEMHARKDEVVSGLRDGVTQLLAQNGVTVLQGRATLLGEGRVAVEGEAPAVLTAKHILLAIGAGPARPPIPGVAHTVTSDELLEGPPHDLKSIAIIGGGVIGMEFAALYGDLGAEVTVLEAAGRILPLLDREISQNLAVILKERGVAIHTGVTVEEIAAEGGGKTVRFSGKAGTQTVTADVVLLATGRVADAEGLLAPGLTLETDRGIVVNERFETSLRGVYAIGDCVHGATQLAHVAAAQAQNAVAHMLGQAPPIRLDLIPACVYTEPEIATVGLDADRAKAEGRPVKTGKFLLSANGKSRIENQPRGFIKLIFDGESEVILGAQLMCGRATELIGTICEAIAAGRRASELSALIRPHPSFSEGIGEAAEDFFGRAIHIAPRRRPL